MKYTLLLFLIFITSLQSQWDEGFNFKSMDLGLVGTHTLRYDSGSDQIVIANDSLIRKYDYISGELEQEYFISDVVLEETGEPEHYPFLFRDVYLSNDLNYWILVNRYDYLMSDDSLKVIKVFDLDNNPIDSFSKKDLRSINNWNDSTVYIYGDSFNDINYFIDEKLLVLTRKISCEGYSRQYQRQRYDTDFDLWFSNNHDSLPDIKIINNQYADYYEVNKDLNDILTSHIIEETNTRRYFHSKITWLKSKKVIYPYESDSLYFFNCLTSINEDQVAFKTSTYSKMRLPIKFGVFNLEDESLNLFNDYFTGKLYYLDKKLFSIDSSAIIYLDPESLEVRIKNLPLGSVENYKPYISSPAYESVLVFPVKEKNEILYISDKGELVVLNAVYTSIQEEDLQFEVYPNPVANELRIKIESNNSNKFEIYNVLGNKILWGDFGPGASDFGPSINVSQLKSGVYFIKTANTTQKFIKE